MKRWITGVLCLALLFSLGCGGQPAASAVGFACDTVVTVTAYAPQSVVDEAIRLTRSYERLLSKTVEGSDVWKLNHANGEPVAVDPETAALLRLAVEIGEASGGAFDVTIASVSALWDFSAETPAVPDASALADAVRTVDYRSIAIDGNTVTLHNGAQIDLGGIAKGYIADCVAAYLKQSGAAHACVNMGGNIVVFGGKPNGEAWTIGVRDPNGTAEQSEEVLSLSDGVLVTSGNYERYFILDGVRYHHILDPKTGMPVQNGLASVTILTDSSALADALSTACFVLGETNSAPLLERYGARAIFLYGDGSRSAYPAS